MKALLSRAAVVSVSLGLVLGFVIPLALPSFASRNSVGTYSLPTGNPVVSGSAISSTVHNATMSDIATELTSSLDRAGRGAMTAPLQLESSSSVSLPALTFSGDADTGLYRIGANNPAMSAGGTKSQEWSSTGTTIPGTLTLAGAAITGITVTQSTSNGNAVTATSNGSGFGVYGSGGTTGVGVSGHGGSSSGTGVYGQGTAGNAVGVVGQGQGSGQGVYGIGGATGEGVIGEGGASGSNGVRGTGTGASSGVLASGGSSHGPGLSATGGGHGSGVLATAGSSADVTNAGITATGAASAGAFGAKIYGDPTTPVYAALHIEPQDTVPSGANSVGDIYVTTAGLLKICTVAGTGGAATWVSVGAQ